MSNQPVYELSGVGKTYAGPNETLTVLADIDLTVDAGQTLAIIGASGSGKTTLLHLLGTLDTPSVGTIRFNGRDLGSLSVEAKAELRNRELGFVFQFHHLLPEFSTLENVAMPGIIAGLPRKEAMARAEEALYRVGLAERARYAVTTLSGGERQRASIARAILLEPKVLLADEPIGSLDEATGHKVADLMLNLNLELGTTLVVVTHNLALARDLGRQLELRSGELYEHSR